MNFNPKSINPAVVWTLKILIALHPNMNLSEDLIIAWNLILGDLSRQELADALETFLKSDQSKFFPKPGQLYALARPQPDLEGEAALLTDKIYYCLESYGSDAYGTERAKERIGELGWVYIQNLGGWTKFTTTVGMVEMSELGGEKARTRKSLMGILERQKCGLPLVPAAEPALEDRAYGKLELVMRQMPKMENG